MIVSPRLGVRALLASTTSTTPRTSSGLSPLSRDPLSLGARVLLEPEIRELADLTGVGVQDAAVAALVVAEAAARGVGRSLET